MMKVIIAGGRDYNNFQVVEDAVLAHVWTALDELAQPGQRAIDVMRDQVEIIQGGARGADALGKRFAEKYGLQTRVFKADWDTHGKKAGMLRNVQMAEQSTDLVAFWDQQSRGTKNMLQEARKRNLHVTMVDTREAVVSNIEWETELKRVVKEEQKQQPVEEQEAPAKEEVKAEPKDTSPLYFSMGKGVNTELSNMYMASFTIGGVTYPSAEHYFQSKKFSDKEHIRQIVMASTATLAKQLGGSRKYPIRGDWNKNRVKVMKVAMWNKFTQNPQLAEYLLGTGGHELIEDNPRDNFWGIGNGNGQNMTGQLLMQLRTKLREQPSAVGSNETSKPSAEEIKPLSDDEKKREPFRLVITAPRKWEPRQLHWDKIQELVKKVRRPIELRVSENIKWDESMISACKAHGWEYAIFGPDEEEQQLDWMDQQNLVHQAMIAEASAVVAFYTAQEKPYNVSDIQQRAIQAELPIRQYHMTTGKRIFQNSKPSAVKEETKA